ncbi:MAG: uroporphyrinogen-III synthase [Bryobacteraceae bacterium]
MPFGGLRVLSLESRRSAEIETLIRRQGGEPFVAPSVKERALDDEHTDAFRMLAGMEAGRFELLVLMTGVGLKFWREVIAARYSIGRADEALGKVRLLARGPKPSVVLRSAGLAPDITIPEPNTWHEIVEAIRRRPERRIAIQEYGRPNREFVAALEQLGAQVDTFALYRWELPEDLGPLCEAVRRLASRDVDVVLFTSSIQLEHLLRVAEERQMRAQVLETLARDVVIGSIGPITSQELVGSGLKPDVTPSSPKMGALVLAAAEQSRTLLAAKRSPA